MPVIIMPLRLARVATMPAINKTVMSTYDLKLCKRGWAVLMQYYRTTSHDDTYKYYRTTSHADTYKYYRTTSHDDTYSAYCQMVAI